MIEPTLFHYFLAIGMPLLFILLMDSDKTKIFASGMVFYLGIQTMIQDFKGKEAVLKFYTENWIDFSPVLGLIIMGIAAITYYGASRRVSQRFHDAFMALRISNIHKNK